jgi:type I restriction enzyme S subunit
MNPELTKTLWEAADKLRFNIGDAVRASGFGGSVFHNLSKSGFEALPVLISDSLLAFNFDKIIEPIVNKVLCNQEQSQNLASLRDTLLPRLMSGQLREPEAERMFEAAA